MATVTMTVEATVDGTPKTLSRSITIDDAVMPHFFDFYRWAYGQVNEGTEDEPVLRDMTDEETFVKYAAGLSQETMEKVQKWLQHQAAEAAKAAVPVISGTPNEE